MTGPVIDRRDGYRVQVDGAVRAFGVDRQWSADHLRRATRICYRVIWTESDWLNYANRKVPGSIDLVPNDGYPSHGGDALSVGLYQQQEKWGWGSPAGSMNPAVATERFLAAMVRDVPAWFTTDEAEVCQRVQRSQFDGKTVDPATGKPFPFAGNYRARDDQVAALAVDPLYFTTIGAKQ